MVSPSRRPRNCAADVAAVVWKVDSATWDRIGVWAEVCFEPGYVGPMAPKIATADVVDLSELLDFIRPRHRMVLTTFRADRSLQSSPVTGGVDAAGRVVVASYPQRAKSINIRRTPKASVVVLSDEFNGAYVQLDGDAEVIDAPEAVEPLVDYYRAIAGEHPDWRDYRRAMLDQGKCLIRVTPRRWGPVATGGFPPTFPAT
jgi:PPOX class probable F420-dependent enzyme